MTDNPKFSNDDIDCDPEEYFAEASRQQHRVRNRARNKTLGRNGRERLSQWETTNPEKAKATQKRSKSERRDRDYFKDVVSLDSEGNENTKDNLYKHRKTGQVYRAGDPIFGGYFPDPEQYVCYPGHDTFMWMSARVSDSMARSVTFRSTECEPAHVLMSKESTDTNKVPLKPREVLEWLVGRRREYGEALFVIFAGGYDMAQILRHFDYISAWEIRKQDKCPTEKTVAWRKYYKQLCERYPDIPMRTDELRNLEQYASKPKPKKFGPVYGRGDFKGFVIRYRDRRMLEIWKLKDPEKGMKYRERKDGEVKVVKNFDDEDYICVYDVFGFFAQSFAKVTKTLKDMGKATKAEYDYMVEMKDKRDAFADLPLPDIVRYTELELRFLSVIVCLVRWSMAKLDIDGLGEKGLRLNSWHGAGAASGQFIRSFGAYWDDIAKRFEGGIHRDHYGNHFEADEPYPQQLAAHSSYYGGHIEMPRHGYIPSKNGKAHPVDMRLMEAVSKEEWDALFSRLFAADIASAYPYRMTLLSSLGPRDRNDFRKRTPDESGGWKEHRKSLSFKSLSELRKKVESMDMLSLFDISYQLPDFDIREYDEYGHKPIPFYPLPFRGKGNKIFYPPNGSGWYNREHLLGAIAWLERFMNAEKWKDGCPQGDTYSDYFFAITTYWEYTPVSDVKPFAILDTMFARRKDIVDNLKDGEVNILEQVIKLILNSMYGKLAQSVGGVLAEVPIEGDESETKQERAFPPSTTNPYYAAAITAGTQRDMMEAACLDPHNVVFFATDCLVTTRALDIPKLYKGKGKAPLGYWEQNDIDGGLFVGAGIYSYWKEWINDKGELKRVAVNKQRGVDPKRVSYDSDINRDFVSAVLEKWMLTDPDKANDDHYVVRPKHKIFVTIGMALSSPQQWLLAGRFSDKLDSAYAATRNISVASPGDKREVYLDRPEHWMAQLRDDGTRYYAQRCYSVIPTKPCDHNAGDDAESVPSKPKWATWGETKETKEAKKTRELNELELEAEAALFDLANAP
jgi:hypothetical protein